MAAAALLYPLVAAGVGSLSYLSYPRLPDYGFHSISLEELDILSFITSLGGKLSFKLEGKTEMDNINFMGIDIYESEIDLYYPDWNGYLENIGYLDLAGTGNDKSAVETSSDQIKMPPRSGILLSSTKFVMDKIPPRVYLQMAKDAILSSGAIHGIPATLSIHAKANGAIPLSIQCTCENSLYVKFSWSAPMFVDMRIEKDDCAWNALKPLIWSDMSMLRNNLKDKFIQKSTESYQEEENEP